jgi:hypothetical protein
MRMGLQLAHYLCSAPIVPDRCYTRLTTHREHSMERQAFIDHLKADGYAEPVLVQRAPNGRLDDHSHPFEAKALILKGEMRIHAGGEIKIYRAGDVFRTARATARKASSTCRAGAEAAPGRSHARPG